MPSGESKSCFHTTGHYLFFSISRFQKRRIHHDCRIFNDQFFLQKISREIKYLLLELIVPTITTPIFTLHPVILLNNTEAVLWFGGYSPFPFQMGFAHVNKELISIVGIVADH